VEVAQLLDEVLLQLVVEELKVVQVSDQSQSSPLAHAMEALKVAEVSALAAALQVGEHAHHPLRMHSALQL